MELLLYTEDFDVHQVPSDDEPKQTDAGKNHSGALNKPQAAISQ